MKKEDIIYYKDFNSVEIITKNKRHYICYIKDILEDSVRIIDKFGYSVNIDFEDISIIQEKGDKK